MNKNSHLYKKCYNVKITFVQEINMNKQGPLYFEGLSDRWVDFMLK